MTLGNIKRVLVTGGAGFIGSNYVRHALHEHPNWEVTVLDKLTYAGNLENLGDIMDRIKFVHGDIADPRVVTNAMDGVDAAINFAAESHVDRSLMDPRPFIGSNVEGPMILLEQARKLGVRRFLQVSTDEVYGDLAGSIHRSVESDRLAPRSPYSASKAAAEHLVMAYGISYGLDVVITRGSNTYGPYQYPEKIIPLFVTNALEGKPLPVYGDGTAVRDYMHVQDHVTGIDLVLHEGETGNVYNLGARTEVSGLLVARRVLQFLGMSNDLIEFVNDRPGHDYRYAVDPTKSEQLGWARQRNFEDGLKDTVEWYAKNHAWWTSLKNGTSHRELVRDWYARRSV